MGDYKCKMLALDAIRFFFVSLLDARNLIFTSEGPSVMKRVVIEASVLLGQAIAGFF